MAEPTDEHKVIADPETGEIVRRIRPFAEWLREHSRGELHDEIGQSLNELVQAVNVHRKPGKLTVTFEVKPQGSDRVTVVGTVDVKQPKPDRDESLFFIDRDFNMVRQDPNQTTMPWGTRPVPPAAHPKEGEK